MFRKRSASEQPTQTTVSSLFLLFTTYGLSVAVREFLRLYQKIKFEIASYLAMAFCHSSGDVQSLENLAFDAFFKEVLLNATSVSVNFIRDMIDQHLIGRVKNNFREKCAAKCYQMMCHKGPLNQPSEMKYYEGDIQYIFAVMDCILEEHFKSLKVFVPSPVLKSFSALMAIITSRCLKLEELQVSFQKRKRKTISPKLYKTIQPGSLLPFLKILTLNFHHESLDTKKEMSNSRSLLSTIGKLCPVLTKLDIQGAVFKKNIDIVALIVNAEFSDILFPSDYAGNRWSQDSIFCGLQIPIQFLNPLCSTLKELTGWRCYSRASDCVSLESAFAFALRHLPKLEKTVLPGAVKLLHQLGGTVDLKPFKKAWRTAAARLGLDIASPVTFFYSGTLSLKRVINIPTLDDSVLLALSELCPQIVEIGFADKRSSIFYPSLKKIIQTWSNKIETVEFFFGDPQFLMMVLDIVGPNLKKLVITSIYSRYNEIDLDYLASICINLEHLAFNEFARVIMNPEVVSRWTPETFLPKLTRFQSSQCLGIWSGLIERKSTLVHLSLECCHIGTKVLNPPIEWSQLPQLWPQLESLEVGDCRRSGLTVDILAEIIPQFEKLRRITLPSHFLSEKDELKRKTMLKESSNRSEETVNIEYHHPLWRRSRCVLFRV